MRLITLSLSFKTSKNDRIWYKYFYAKHLIYRLVRISKKHSHCEIFAAKRCIVVGQGEVVGTISQIVHIVIIFGWRQQLMQNMIVIISHREKQIFICCV